MKIAVIGGGPSGLVAAGSASGAQVTLFERGEKVGKKIYITGKGRCNFTNVCEPSEFLTNVTVNSPFLRSALAVFPPVRAVELVERLGCPVTVERGRRAFPSSGKASDVTKALCRYALENETDIRLDSFVEDITHTGDGFTLTVNGVKHDFDRVIVCTGGKSYPSTGSDGNGYALLEKLGHGMVPQAPSLVALRTRENLGRAEGLTLKNVTLAADGIKPIFGDLMITSDGISGPIALTLSSYASRRATPYKVYLDLKPALDIEALDARLVKDFSIYKNKQFKNSLDLLLPKSLTGFIIKLSEIPDDKPINSVTRAERRRLAALLKRVELTIVGNEGFDRAVVTSGGADVKQVDPKTMESKLVKGLFLCGEVLDTDALTGGYNFHIALATGFAAGRGAVRSLK